MAPKSAKDKAAREDAAKEAAEARYKQWKRLVPVLYDSFTNNNLVWPSLSCRWGPQVENYTYKVKQRAYLSEQTDGSVPNTLVVANVEIPRPHVADAESMQSFNYDARSPLVKKYKTIIHPGEVNRIREYPEAQNIVATHSDSPMVYVWNVDTQPERGADAKVAGSAASVPDLQLTGHKQFAEFALAFHPKEPRLISGGRDGEVLLWHLADQMTSLASTSAEAPPADGGGAGRKSVNSGGLGGLDGDTPTKATEVAERGRFPGHTDTIEDVVFRPSSGDEFCSVGDDAAIIFWDARQEGGKPAAKVASAHDDDIHCVDWSAEDEHAVLTGGADHSVRLFDRRKLAAKGKAAVVATFAAHTAAILNVQWCPHRKGVFASGGEDGLVMVWDAERAGAAQNGSGNGRQPPELMFQHAGHRDKVVDFQWNTADPWTILSVSDDISFAGGGGALQIWRMNDLIYKPEEEALGELKRHRDYVTGKTNRVPDKAPKTAEVPPKLEEPTDMDTEAKTEAKTEDKTEGKTEDKTEAEPKQTAEEADIEEASEAKPETDSKAAETAETPAETAEEVRKEPEVATQEGPADEGNNAGESTEQLEERLPSAEAAEAPVDGAANGAENRGGNEGEKEGGNEEQNEEQNEGQNEGVQEEGNERERDGGEADDTMEVTASGAEEAHEEKGEVAAGGGDVDMAEAPRELEEPYYPEAEEERASEGAGKKEGTDGVVQG
ncbi:nucleosome assembly factor [Klebsormidium nitens]|uniref:Nucleosome assembly factor n=1 Tax=Klebsormidium nitens TaxID=105231 RepID=A0A1Y1HMC4_KLENI|nr:nucleosome assembly factor [Klebsormidium nitens]|eukprot:GAQ79765.1 nucleosome assembly factor [Klebsormidium nitens]